MTVHNRSAFLLIHTLIFTAIGCSSSLGTKELTGIVQASRTDDDDRAVDGFIFDGKEEFYLIDGSVKDKLLDQVDAKVRVKGEISESWFTGKKYIDIDTYKIVERVN
jgi:hypothetical protein